MYSSLEFICFVVFTLQLSNPFICLMEMPLEISDASGKCNMDNSSLRFFPCLFYARALSGWSPCCFLPLRGLLLCTLGQPLSISVENRARLWSGGFCSAPGTTPTYLQQAFEVSRVVFPVHWRFFECGIILDK